MQRGNRRAMERPMETTMPINRNHVSQHARTDRRRLQINVGPNGLKIENK
jgi:hypothetical protein